MIKRTLYLAALILLPLGVVSLASSQFEFFATLNSVVEQTADSVVIEVQLTPTVTTQVRATNATEIKDQDGLPLDLTDLANLSAGTTLKIEGVFSDSVILAEEIKVSESASDFELKGTIQSLDSSSTPPTLTVLGFEIQVPAEAEIKDADGNVLTFGDLMPDQFVKVEGMVDGSNLVAQEIHVGEPGNGFARINFDGIVKDLVSDTSFLVQIDGGTTALVKINDNTKVRGTLAVGVAVKVIGRLDPELAVAADEIIVKRSLQLAPDELKMGFNQTRQVVVILRGAKDNDVTLDLASDDPDIAMPMTDQVTIPAGHLNATFQVQSKAQAGETLIHVTLPAVQGGSSEDLKVEVKDQGSEDDNENELVLHWTPAHLNMQMNETKSATLRLDHVVDADTEIQLQLKDGSLDLTFPDTVVIPAGSNMVQVIIQSGTMSGEAELRATLSDPMGDSDADLEIKVHGEAQGNLELEWKPDEVEAGFNQTIPVKLQLNRPAPPDAKVIISVKEGDASLLEDLPTEVSFSPGSREVTVMIKTKDQAGELKIQAALPFASGGDTAELEIKIQE